MPNKWLVYDYSRSNFDAHRKRLADVDICSLLTNNGTDSSIDDDWTTWKNAVMTAINEFIPTIYADPRRLLSSITPTILPHIRIKVAVRKTLLNRGTEHFEKQFRKLRTQVKKMIQERVFLLTFRQHLASQLQTFFVCFQNQF